MKKTVSRIDELGVRDLVEQMFEIPTATYDDIIAKITEQTGETVSDSLLSRARQQWSARKALEASKTQEVETLVRVLKGEPGLNLDDTLMVLLKKKIAERLADAEATFADTNLLELCYLLVRAVRAGQSGASLTLQRERLALLSQRVATVADKVEQIAKAKDLDDDTLKTIREEIYGLSAA